MLPMLQPVKRLSAPQGSFNPFAETDREWAQCRRCCSW